MRTALLVTAAHHLVYEAPRQLLVLTHLTAKAVLFQDAGRQLTLQLGTCI